MTLSMIRLFLFCLLVSVMPVAGNAQFLPSLGGAASESVSAADVKGLSEAIKQAAESGVNVIVLDGDGKVVSAAGPVVASEPAKDEAAHMADGSRFMKAQSKVHEFRETLLTRVEALPTSLNEVAFILRATSPDGRIMTYVEVMLWTLLLLGVSYFIVGEVYGKRLIKGVVVSRVMEAPEGYREKMPFLVLRFVAGVGGSILTMITAYSIGTLIFGTVDDQSVQLTIAAIYTAFFVVRTVSDIWRMMFSPFLSQYRIPRLSDLDAKRLYHWAWLLAAFDVSTVIFSTWVADFGLNYNVYAILYGVLALIGTFLNILLVLFNKRAVSYAIRNGREPNDVAWVVRAFSVIWAPFLICYFLFSWLELAFDLVLEQQISIPMSAGLYGAALSILVVYGLINYVIERYFDRSRAVQRMKQAQLQSEASAEAGGISGEIMDVDDAEYGDANPQHSISTYEELARRVSGILAVVAGAYAMVRIWDPKNELLNDSLADRGLDVIVIIFIGFILYHFFRIWIDSKIARETVDQVDGELGDEGGATGASRLATLLPLFRGAILATVVISIALIALMEVGINVSPLFAGAGVIGLAVGFGAQTLVRDIFSGAFFLIDDAFRKGEYIDIGDVKGTVEKISVRSFQLRHHRGALNTVPFGEIKVLANYSRDWVIMKLPLRVTYDTDVEKVRKLIKNLGISLLDDPVIGDSFIQPLKSQGVIEMQDSAMIIRVKFMTKPGDQWLVRKRVYEDIRQLFESEGINFAHRQVTVRLAEDQAEDLTPRQREAVMGAAQGIIEEEEEGQANSDDR